MKYVIKNTRVCSFGLRGFSVCLVFCFGIVLFCLVCIVGGRRKVI